jgi:trimeric autotransporter adhesin
MAAVTADCAPATTTTTTTATPGGTGSGSAACAAALKQEAADQAAVTKDQAAVSADETALINAVQADLPSSTSGTTPTTTPTGSGSSSTRESGGGTGGGAGGSGAGSGARTGSGTGSGASASVVDSADQLASDQAAIDVAQAQLAAAQQDLADATLVTPIAGTVASVSIDPGASVTGGSSSGSAASAAIVVLGPGSYEVTTDIPVASLPGVKVGAQATVTPDATGTTVDGTVASIGLVGTTTSTSTTYPVTISVPGNRGLRLLSGADAEVGIVLRRAVDVTAVPSSSVRTIGSNHFVSELHNGTLTEVRVTTGTVGQLLTQVTSGIKPGDQVVLADYGEPLPTSNTTTTGRTGLAGGFGGGGGFGGSGGGGFGGGTGRFSRAG